MSEVEVGIAIAFTAGLLSFLSPCVLPLVPSYLTFVTGMSLEDLQEGVNRRATFVHSLLFVLGISYYAGGYVAGRMSRFDGGRQGLGVWMIGLVMTGVAMAVGLLTGAELNLLDRVDVPPSVPSTSRPWKP